MSAWSDQASPQQRVDGEHDEADLDAFEALLASMPLEVAAQAEAHGVIQPMTVYVEA